MSSESNETIEHLKLTSERLLLRPIGAQDVEALHTIWTEESVRRFLWDGERIPFDRTCEIVRENQALFEKMGLGIWGVRERSSIELIGFTGYRHFHDPPSLELLFGVSKDHWRRGFASESSRCVIGYAFEQLELDEIAASTDTENFASIRVLENLGMALTRREVVDGLNTAFYNLSRAAWRGDPGDRPSHREE